MSRLRLLPSPFLKPKSFLILKNIYTDVHTLKRRKINFRGGEVTVIQVGIF